MGSNLLRDIEAARVPSREEPSAIERLILKHAMKSFGRRGYAATTLRGVAQDANVTAPMVSYYFKSKEGLYNRVAEIVLSSLESEVRAAIERSSGFHATIEAVARAHVELSERSPSAVEFMFSMLYGPQEGQPMPDIQAMYRTTRRLIAEVFEKGIRSGELRLREGMSPSYLVERFGSLIHDHVSRRFRIRIVAERRPERRAELEARSREWSLEVALDHFFHGAGELRAPEKT
jgi:AcrR family transcriptional regulator